MLCAGFMSLGGCYLFGYQVNLQARAAVARLSAHAAAAAFYDAYGLEPDEQPLEIQMRCTGTAGTAGTAGTTGTTV